MSGGEANRLYLGNGDGTFAPGTDVSADAYATQSILLSDVNSDSRLDVIAGNSGWANRLYLGNGNGTFAASLNITNDAHGTHSVAAYRWVRCNLKILPTVGLPETVSLDDFKVIVGAQEHNMTGGEETIGATQDQNITIRIPHVIYDEDSEDFYRLARWSGTGDLADRIFHPGPDEAYEYEFQIKTDSTIQFHYEKAYQLTITVDGADESKAGPKVSHVKTPTEPERPVFPDDFVDYTIGRPVFCTADAIVTLTVQKEAPAALGGDSRLICTGTRTKAGYTLGAYLYDEDDRKTLTFSLGEETHIEWIYKEASLHTISESIDPPVPTPGDWKYESQIEIIEGHPGDTAENAFYWDTTNEKLYAVRALPYFEIKWSDGTVSKGYSEWPPAAQEPIVNSPVNLQHAAATHTFKELSYSESYTDDAGTFILPSELSKDGSAGTKPVFKPPKAGRSVLRFSDKADNPVFIIVKAIDLAPLETQDWDIGNPIGDVPPVKSPPWTIHNDPEGKNGYVYHENAYYDGYGTDRAYDRETRTGPIIPVNVSYEGMSGDQKMVVVWYHTDENGIAWPVRATEYNLKWPDAPEGRIIIASGNGSRTLEEYEYTGLIYYQADRDAPGYNPNEEHALLEGNKIFALRNDLNRMEGSDYTSEPYVLLKFTNPDTGLWEMKAFKVEAEGTDDGSEYHDFTYDITAGKPIIPLMPMDLFPHPAESGRDEGAEECGADCYHRDHKGGHWAKAAAEGDTTSEITMHWYYPLQKGFYIPSTYAGGDDLKEGDPVPFLNGGDSHDDPPRDVVYEISWPTDVSVLQIGETLTEAKYGLPDLVNWASGEVIFDENVYAGEGPLAKLFDPFAERSVKLEIDEIPEEITTESIGGKVRFPDLPYVLRERLLYNPTDETLNFKGISYDPGIGDPLLLPNVMTLNEKNRLVALSDKWGASIDKLFGMTRDPNGVSPLPAKATDPIQNPYNSELAPEASAWDASWGILLGIDKRTDDPDTGAIECVVPQKLVGLPMALTAGMAAGEGHLVLAENDDESLGSAPVALHVIRVEGGPHRGEIKAIKSDNVFDEKLTLRHSGDFGGEPEKLYFKWYYKPDNTGLPPRLPGTSSDQDTIGWTYFGGGPGLIDITIEGAGKLTLTDNWFMVHYYYGKQSDDEGSTATYPSLIVHGEEDSLGDRYWSDWAGAPGGQTAQLAEGWIKRVVSDLNPLEARVKDFRNYAASTDVSMITQLGARYEGDIALNASPDNLNNLGLIEAYQTVLNRAAIFSIDASPPVDYGPANTAMLNAATRIADFYVLLGNEAYADAMDPTIGFDTKSGSLGSTAASIYAFQNQLDTLLSEELTLLRGRDDTMSTTRARPVYNRLLWNFTGGDGEVAYQQTYNISDQNTTGVIDELDAKIMYPQGHGDAWGHYLTGMKVWYGLLRHDYYTWEPRIESVLVGGAPVPVDYLDERKFARAAAAKAKAGAEIVNLTYRRSYVEDPAGQWQGYKDTDVSRSWGVDGWGRRSGQGALFDWVVANAILPSEDPVKTHTGITKIDRTTVPELADIASQFIEIQTQMDQADRGLNPLGLAKGVVPFDIDPNLLTPSPTRETKTHFEQTHDRAVAALENTRTVFDYATQYTLMLRANDDTLTNFKRTVEEQERDYWSRLIEIFGYPYAGDIGPGGTYKAGYDGPDWLHFMYVDLPDLTGEPLYNRTIEYKATFETKHPKEWNLDDKWKLASNSFNEKKVYQIPGAGGSYIDIVYYTNTEAPWPSKPEGWGKRRAPGEIQLALGDLVKAHANHQRGLTELEGLIGGIDSAVNVLKARYNITKHQIMVKDTASGAIKNYDYALNSLLTVKQILERAKDFTKSGQEVSLQYLPKVVGIAFDPSGPIRGTITGISSSVRTGLNFATDAISIAENWLSMGKDHTAMARDRQLFIDDARFEVVQMVEELGCMEGDVRAKIQELFTLREVIIQALGRYQAALAKGERLLTERETFRKRTAADVQDYRYQDLGFRVFRNDAVQKYRATFDLAARYAYLAATAYDYETNLLGSDIHSGRTFLTDIVKQRSPGDIIMGEPVVGKRGLADSLARLGQNFQVYKGQLGFNNPQIETNRFSLRKELFRIKSNPESDRVWKNQLNLFRVDDLLDFQSFKRYCRPFAGESTGSQPGIVIPFSTEVLFGRNYFGWPLGGGDSAYDPTNFSTRIRSVGIWLTGYDTALLANTPRIYLVPVGADVLRSPAGDDFVTREWHIVDQKLPVPFAIGDADITGDTWIPANDSLNGSMGETRRFSSFRAYPDDQDSDELDAITIGSTMDTRLIGRSVWNTQWLLIIPGGTLLADPEMGLDTFVETVTDIKLFFQTYAYSGD